MKQSLQRFLVRMKNFGRREDGPTAVEYAVMLALIIVVVIGAITTLGHGPNRNAPLIPADEKVVVKGFTIDQEKATVEFQDGTKKIFVKREAKEGEIQATMILTIRGTDGISVTTAGDKTVAYEVKRE